jgi:hypothetical protein
MHVCNSYSYAHDIVVITTTKDNETILNNPWTNMRAAFPMLLLAITFATTTTTTIHDGTKTIVTKETKNSDESTQDSTRTGELRS